ncbi:type II toxin-antitoxin system RelE/ParE family toxin [Thiorhodococcus minor]|uniref:Type II toxin-antitoxin system RelE/ParE family toxin n=1 Tax=Thiorhodococcus minor TaxID=57489 RepID=A0A6M0JYC4_9GAMM|nr:type II toxin-antitoxin system RelE/ParE family toxin [Thiorhodococcus minor]NEV62021.1 type II toxin-antitoxin system RelE/ParE family toxin [Thiorhodococcus minor]
MVFIETSLFSRLVARYLTDDQYAALQAALMLHPDAGDLVPGSGGVRKLRWSGSGRGKRGGLRIIYYWRNRSGQVWLLTLYAKNDQSNIPPHVLRAIAEEISDE